MPEKLTDRIDTGNDGISLSDLTDFMKDPKNLQELANELNNNMQYSDLDGQLKRVLEDYVLPQEIIGKIGKEPLTEAEVQIFYIKYLVENPGQYLEIKSQSSNLFEKYGGNTLINFIVTKYGGLKKSEDLRRIQSQVQPQPQILPTHPKTNTIPSSKTTNTYKDQNIDQNQSYIPGSEARKLNLDQFTNQNRERILSTKLPSLNLTRFLKDDRLNEDYSYKAFNDLQKWAEETYGNEYIAKRQALREAY